MVKKPKGKQARGRISQGAKRQRGGKARHQAIGAPVSLHTGEKQCSCSFTWCPITTDKK